VEFNKILMKIKINYVNQISNFIKMIKNILIYLIKEIKFSQILLNLIINKNKILLCKNKKKIIENNVINSLKAIVHMEDINLKSILIQVKNILIKLKLRKLIKKKEL